MRPVSSKVSHNQIENQFVLRQIFLYNEAQLFLHSLKSPRNRNVASSAFVVRTSRKFIVFRETLLS